MRARVREVEALQAEASARAAAEAAAGAVTAAARRPGGPKKKKGARAAAAMAAGAAAAAPPGPARPALEAEQLAGLLVGEAVLGGATGGAAAPAPVLLMPPLATALLADKGGRSASII